MQDFEILEEMMNKQALMPLQKEYGRSIVILDEPQTTNSAVTIRNLPDETLVIKVDMFNAPDQIFNGRKGECKRADYVIISPAHKCIVYIELKRTRDAWNEIVKQLKGAQCLVSYCKNIGQTFWNSREFMRNYKQRFISIGHIGIPKRKTRMEKPTQSAHDKPEKAMKIDWPNYVEFNKLAGN